MLMTQVGKYFSVYNCRSIMRTCTRKEASLVVTSSCLVSPSNKFIVMISSIQYRHNTWMIMCVCECMSKVTIPHGRSWEHWGEFSSSESLPWGYAGWGRYQYRQRTELHRCWVRLPLLSSSRHQLQPWLARHCCTTNQQNPQPISTVQAMWSWPRSCFERYDNMESCRRSIYRSSSDWLFVSACSGESWFWSSRAACKGIVRRIAMSLSCERTEKTIKPLSRLFSTSLNWQNPSRIVANKVTDARTDCWQRKTCTRSELSEEDRWKYRSRAILCCYWSLAEIQHTCR